MTAITSHRTALPAPDSWYREHISAAVEAALKRLPSESLDEDRTALTRMLFKVLGIDACQPGG